MEGRKPAIRAQQDRNAPVKNESIRIKKNLFTVQIGSAARSYRAPRATKTKRPVVTTSARVDLAHDVKRADAICASRFLGR